MCVDGMAAPPGSKSSGAPASSGQEHKYQSEKGLDQSLIINILMFNVMVLVCLIFTAFFQEVKPSQ